MNNIVDNLFFVDVDEEDDDLDDLIVIHILNDNDLLGNRAALYGVFDFQSLSNAQCLSMFRFEKDHILQLVRALGLPQQLLVNRVSISGIEKCMFNLLF